MDWLFVLVIMASDTGGVGSITMEFPTEESCLAYGESLDPSWDGGWFTSDPKFRYTCIPTSSHFLKEYEE